MSLLSDFEEANTKYLTSIPELIVRAAKSSNSSIIETIRFLMVIRLFSKVDLFYVTYNYEHVDAEHDTLESLDFILEEFSKFLSDRDVRFKTYAFTEGITEVHCIKLLKDYLEFFHYKSVGIFDLKMHNWQLNKNLILKSKLPNLTFETRSKSDLIDVIDFISSVKSDIESKEKIDSNPKNEEELRNLRLRVKELEEENTILKDSIAAKEADCDPIVNSSKKLVMRMIATLSELAKLDDLWKAARGKNTRHTYLQEQIEKLTDGGNATGASIQKWLDDSLDHLK